MRAGPTWTLHITCPNCEVPLHVSLRGFLGAEGFHRCPWCRTALLADARQLRLLYSAQHREDWYLWAEELPGVVEVLTRDRLRFPVFGPLLVDYEERMQAGAAEKDPPPVKSTARKRKATRRGALYIVQN